MWYKYAMEYGDSEGTIRCAYAMLYNEHGQRLFALQRKNFDNSTAAIVDRQTQQDPNATYQWAQDQWGNAVYTGAGKQGIFYWDAGGSAKTGFVPTGYMQIDFPVVVAKKWSGEKLVPVTLSWESATYIQETLKRTQKNTKWIVWHVYDAKTGDLLRTFYKKKDTLLYQDKSKYQIVKEKRMHPWLEELKGKINTETVFYIKPAAFNWHPINLKNKPVVVTQDLRQKKVDLDRARMAVILAGGLTLI